MATLDAILRFGAFGQLALVALVMLRQGARSPAERATLLLLYGLAGYTLCSAPVGIGLGSLSALPLALLCAAVPALFWLFAQALFDDDFAFAPWHGLALAGFLAVRVAGPALATAAAPSLLLASLMAGHGLALAAVGHSLWTALRGRRVDLIAARRSFRVVFAGVVGGYSALVLAAELGTILLTGPDHPAVRLLAWVNGAGLFLLTLLFAAEIVALRSDRLFPPTVAEPTAPATVTLAPADRPLLAALLAELEERKAHREPGLTIGVLAGRLKVPEHRLRSVINQGLGHKNFNAFLNRYRVAEVEAALRDPERARVPILTLALDAGFQSLGPFNRAFKAVTGRTPSEVRRAALDLPPGPLGSQAPDKR